jgi:hypothetical protein
MRPFAQLEHDLNQEGFFRQRTEEDLYRAAYKLDGTAHLLLELVQSAKKLTRDDFDHCVVPTTGPTGSGKSTIVQKEASFLRAVIYKDHKILNTVHSTWSPLATISRLRYGKVKDLDSFYQDEHRKGRVGQGSATNDWLLQQAEETLRANGNSFFFCSPSPRKHIPHWIQEVIGYDINTGYNEFFVLGPRFQKPICRCSLGPGFVIDPHILETYIADKREYNAKIKEGGGWVGEIDTEIEQFTYDEIMAHVTRGMKRPEVEHIYNELNLFPGFYMNRVVGRVMVALRKLEEEHKELVQREHQEEAERLEREQKAMFEEVSMHIINYVSEDLGLKKRPVLGAIKSLARQRGIVKDYMTLFTDYFQEQWMIHEATMRTVEGKAEATGDELVDRGHRAEARGKNEEIRWQNRFKTLLDTDPFIKSIKPKNGRRAGPGEPDLRVWTNDGGLWLLAVKYRKDYHNAWIPYFLKSGEEKPCPEFRLARAVLQAVEAHGGSYVEWSKNGTYAAIIDKKGLPDKERKWIPSYMIVAFCGQIAGNEFFESVNYVNPENRGFETQNEVGEYYPLDISPVLHLKRVLGDFPSPKG